MDGGVTVPTDVEEPKKVRQPQAAESSDFVAVLVAVLVLPALEDASAEVDDDEPEDELPGSLEGAELLLVPEPLPEPWCESLPVLRREPPRESLRESLR